MIQSASCQWRAWLVLVLVIILAGLLAGRLFILQVINRHFYRALAQNQHQLSEQLIPQRGEIFIQDKYTQDYFPVAVNRQQAMVYAMPRRLEANDAEPLVKSLAEILKMPSEFLREIFNKKDDPYEPIKSKLTDEEVQKIKELNSSVLGLASETNRYYPAKALASQVIGFLGYGSDQKPKGQYGIEGYYQDELVGQPGVFEGEKDTAGRWINLAAKKIIAAVDGPDLVLTLDQNIQFMVEETLEKLISEWQAPGGVIIVMEPSSGAIRGLANWPSFDLNQYNQIDNYDIFLNSAIQKLYEPGSVFKPIVMAAALNEGKISASESYVDQGFVNIGGYQIRNADDKTYGQQTMSQILERSINTGAIYVEQKLDDKLFLDYIKKFGLAEKTGVDLSGERAGNINNLLSGRPINFATASFGQGIAITPLELISAIGAIANQGKLMKPFLVAKEIMADGKVVENQPEVQREVISPQTSQVLTQMLVNSIERGMAKKGKLDGYWLAGKTGTAQIPNPEGGYSETDTLHSFVGYGPVDEPRFIVLLMLYKPQAKWSSNTLAPAFREIAKYLVDYYEIPPEQTRK